MKRLTKHERLIRDKKDLTISELKEKMRIVAKEATQFDKDLLELSKQTHKTWEKREKRIRYAGVLRQELNRKINEELI